MIRMTQTNAISANSQENLSRIKPVMVMITELNASPFTKLRMIVMIASAQGTMKTAQRTLLLVVSMCTSYNYEK